MYFSSALLATVAALAGSATSSILWDGRFNDLTSSTDLNNWSWSNQVGPYQYYIHGSGAVTEYVNLSPSYKNPADTGSTKGAKITLTSTAYWNGQNMRRTELIPQTTAAIAAGTVWYHFSIMRSDVNPPSIYREHQIAFFESHFTELKSGGSGGSDTLRWCVSGTDKWTTPWTAGVWHNVAYEINFAAGSVAFWHSTGSDPLTLTVPAVSVSASSNGADWHVGVLELPVDGQADAVEDLYFSGVYIESGSLTKTVAGPGGVVSSSSAVSASVPVSSSTTGETSSSSSVSLVQSSSTTVRSVSSSIVASSSVAAAQPTIVAVDVSSSISSSSITPLSSSSASIAATVEGINTVSSSSTASAIKPTSTSLASKSVCSKKPLSTSISTATAVAPAATQSAVKSSSSVAATIAISSKSLCSKKPTISASSIPTTFATQIAVQATTSSSSLPSSSALKSVCSKKLTSVGASSAKPSTTLSTATTSKAATTTSAAAGGTLAKWSQCGGQGWTGTGTCVSGTTCTAQNAYYSQCL